jgi:hypothetical protein
MTTTIRPQHLHRPAYVYLRQSTPGQVHTHRESTERQSLNFSHFVARQIWWGRGAPPRRGRAHRLQRREPLRGLLVPLDTTVDLLQTARN